MRIKSHEEFLRGGLVRSMKIAILSDTHNLLRPEVIEYLRGSDCILHGGDISRQEILDRLEESAPVKAVRGNNDKDGFVMSCRKGMSR